MSRVLLVEDEAAVALLVSITLEDEGHEVVVRPNGRKGLEAMRAGGFDVVVTDFMMPSLDGVEMIRAARAEGIAMPVVLTSAVPERRVPGRDEGLYQGFLQKPYHEDRLVQLVERLLNGAEGDDLREGRKAASSR
ncbi:two-component system response regulator RegX3 [Hasllibacter halocynthiae]|uniref:Two-component system response regulator RegX3 n=1 Tax=Hasllibacter halocynthiae TaxID=595589 RepID=A0A2T0X9P0_9RHOB|nr:response regulator [Hasllibacter halocynthiae]PRY95584.1 two-component system response regulator RegX3 [Hasllibacter halocynthiae]